MQDQNPNYHCAPHQLDSLGRFLVSAAAAAAVLAFAFAFACVFDLVVAEEACVDRAKTPAVSKILRALQTGSVKYSSQCFDNLSIGNVSSNIPKVHVL